MYSNKTAYLSLMIIIFVLFPACVPNRSGLGVVGIRDKASIFSSGEYVLVKPQGNDNLSELAQTHLGHSKWTWKIEDANDGSNSTRESLITIPLKESHLGGIFEYGYQIVPIFCYHRFGVGKKSPLITPPHVFHQQMAYLKNNGYRTISPEDLLNFIEYRRQIPKKSVLITFDDGYRSALKFAVPVLMRFGFTATFFVYTDYVGISKKALSWKDLNYLKTKGFTIGSHSVSHSDLTKPDAEETSGEFNRRLKKEIITSKKIIDRKLNQDTLVFSFPFGRYNQDVLSRVKVAGYKLAVTVDRGSNPFFINPLALKRHMLLKRDIDSFISKLETFNEISLK